MLADQREEAQRTQERVQGHLNAMAMRLGELQAQMMRLDGLGERLAKVAGLKPQELPSLAAGPGAGTRRRRVVDCRRATCRSTSSRTCSRASARQIDQRTDQLGVLEALLVHDLGQPQVPADAATRSSTAGISSNFGYRIDPFTGQQSFHEGIDFPAEARHADRRGGERQGDLRGMASRTMVK